MGHIGRIGNLSLADYRDSRTSLGYMAHRQARSRNASAVTGRRALRPARWKGKAYGRRTAPMFCISPPTVVSFAASAIFRTGASRRLRGGSPEPPPSAQTSSIASDPRKRPMPKANAAAASPITIRLERSESRDFSPQAACSRTMCSTSTRHIPSFTLVRAGIGVAIVPESARASRFEEVGYGLIMRMQKRSRVERGTDRSGRREHAPFRVSRGVLRLTSCRIERGHVERRRDEGAFANSRQPII